MKFPSDIERYSDKYFLRSLEILKKEKLNPFIRAQVFIREGPGRIYGINEVVELIEHASVLKKNGGMILSLQEGEIYESDETILLIEGRVQDIISLETLILGIISGETTKRNDNISTDLEEIKKHVLKITTLVGERPIIYFGARHYRYDEDKEIAKAVFAGGAVDASTDIAASIINKEGIGTIPHSLECIFAWKYGMSNAVVKTIEAFDKHIDSKIPRVALIDFNNKEIDDSLKVAYLLKERIYGIRVDTCNENEMQFAKSFENHRDEDFWNGKGVTIGGVYSLRKMLTEKGFDQIKIMLSGGFGAIEKVRAFVEAEKELGISLFDALGIGQVYQTRVATMDVVGVGESLDTLKNIAKVGRKYKRNNRLKER
jgi:nicotinate phosphoribosyltransferase